MKTSPEWMLSASCASVGYEEFFPENGASSRDARRVCAACPVVNECLAYAIHSPVSLSGIWGAKTEMQRRGARRKLGLPIS